MEERFRITDLHDVNSVMKTIKGLEDKKKENEAFAEVEIEKVNNWLESVNKVLENSIEYYKGLLLEYYLEEKRNNPKLKTLSVPNGKFKCRTTKKINYDDDKMLQYLKDNHSSLIETVEKFNKSEVKKLFQNGVDQFTGEIVDWITETEEVTYTVKTAE
jgi:hypothetical protein